jgi:hypothetical protein
MVKRMRKTMKRGRTSRRSGQSRPNFLTFSGRVGLFSSAAASTTFWMNPNSAFTSGWLGFAPVLGGVFGNNANNIAHCYKQFRITRLKLRLPPQVSINQLCAYTQSVGYVTTTLSFPTVAEYPSFQYSGLGETVTKSMNVPSSVLSSGMLKWYSTEANPGASSTDPASDPNLSSQGLLIITDGASAGYPYILDFTIQFRDPESLTQINPSPFRPLSVPRSKLAIEEHPKQQENSIISPSSSSRQLHDSSLMSSQQKSRQKIISALRKILEKEQDDTDMEDVDLDQTIIDLRKAYDNLPVHDL